MINNKTSNYLLNLEKWYATHTLSSSYFCGSIFFLYLRNASSSSLLLSSLISFNVILFLLNPLTTTVPQHIENNQLICRPNWLVSIWWGTLVVNGLTITSVRNYLLRINNTDAKVMFKVESIFNKAAWIQTATLLKGTLSWALFWRLSSKFEKVFTETERFLTDKNMTLDRGNEKITVAKWYLTLCIIIILGYGNGKPS